jgi:hypothetical protein
MDQRVNDKMRELGITATPEDMEEEDRNDETNNLELAAEHLREWVQKQSMFTESNTIRTVCLSRSIVMFRH